MGKFLRSSTFEGRDPNTKYLTRGTALANTANFSPENNSESLRSPIELGSRADVQSRRSWHLGLGRSQNEANYHALRDAWSDESSWSIQKRETYFGDFTLKFNSKPYLHTCIFLDDISTVFLPYIDTLHDLGVFAPEGSVLLRDNYSVPVSGDVIRILTEATVYGIAFAPHIT
jgi:hypothetical protein